MRTEVEENMAIITLDNPPLNVLGLQVLMQLRRAIVESAALPGVRGLVITGAGEKAFSAGADIKSFQRLGKEDIFKYVKIGQETFSLLEEIEVPVAAAVRGVALGGGNELAMACDYRVASYNARFGQPEVAIGMVPGWGGTQRLPRIVGKAKALEMILTGQAVDASEALRLGLVNRVVPSDQVLDTAKAFVRATARSAPLAVTASKLAVNRGLQLASIQEGLKLEHDAVAKVAGSQDLQEGVEAFFLKRPPKFQGR